MWQKHQNWRHQDEADAAYLEAEWRKANRAYKGLGRLGQRLLPVQLQISAARGATDAGRSQDEGRQSQAGVRWVRWSPRNSGLTA